MSKKGRGRNKKEKGVGKVGVLGGCGLVGVLVGVLVCDWEKEEVWLVIRSMLIYHCLGFSFMKRGVTLFLQLKIKN